MQDLKNDLFWGGERRQHYGGEWYGIYNLACRAGEGMFRAKNWDDSDLLY